MQPAIAPRALCFDFDRVLGEFNPDVTVKGKRLSMGAALTMPGVTAHKKKLGEIKLDYSKIMSENPGHCGDGGSGGMFGVMAYEKFQDIFCQIAEENRRNPGSISFKIITAGPYLKDNIIDIMNKYYPGTIFGNKDEIDFYNRVDIWGPDAAWDNKIGDDPSPAKVPVSNLIVKSGIADKCKGLVMEREFPTWNFKQPGLTKDNTYFFDDNDAYVEGVKLCGFKAVHFPTSPADRQPGVTFDINIFSQIQNIILRRD